MTFSLIISIICGVAIGILSGLLGIGGGTMVVPYLRLGLALNAIEATATSLFTIIPTSIAGFLTHAKNKTCICSVGVAAGLGGALTSPIGVYLAKISPSILIMFVAACVIVYSASTMLYKFFKVKSDSVSKKETAGEDRLEKRISPSVILKAVIIGIFAGIASGYVGVGGGFLMVPLFESVLGISIKKCSGTSLLAVCILAIPGVITQGILGNIDYLAGIAVALGTIPGAVIGGSLVKKVPERALRLTFATFLFVVACALVANEFVF